MTRRRFKKDDWIALGTQELATHGPEAVKLEAICKAAGLTRGSFYHHFEDHEAFLTAIADAWLTSQTMDVAKAVEPDASPVDQSDALTEAALKIDFRLELGIRELGRRMPAIETIIKSADAIRLQVMTSLYQRRFDIDEGRAADLAFIEYAAFSGILLVDPNIAPDRQRALARLYDETLASALGLMAPT